MCVCAHARACTHVLSCFHHVRLFVTLWTVAHQACLSMGFSRQEYWTGLLCPPPGDLPNPGTEPVPPVSPRATWGTLIIFHRKLINSCEIMYVKCIGKHLTRINFLIELIMNKLNNVHGKENWFSVSLFNVLLWSLFIELSFASLNNTSFLNYNCFVKTSLIHASHYEKYKHLSK